MNIDIYPIHKEFEHLLKLYPPVKARDFLPDWYKKQQGYKKEEVHFGPNVRKAKHCPAITHELTDGIIIPSWSDVTIKYTKDETQWWCSVGEINWRGSNEKDFNWLATHGYKQTEHMDLNVGFFGAMKLNSPYYIKTEEGVWTKFTDLFHHIRRDIRFIPGTVETDIWHEVNFPFEFNKPLQDNVEETLIIKAGDPLIMITPIKASPVKPTVTLNEYSEDFVNDFRLHELKHRSQSLSWRKYKQYRKGIDEEE
jgi:hypothetical protein